MLWQNGTGFFWIGAVGTVVFTLTGLCVGMGREVALFMLLSLGALAGGGLLMFIASKRKGRDG